MLAIFNMLPLPPLDGGCVVVGLLPNVLAVPFSRLESYGMMILARDDQDRLGADLARRARGAWCA